MNYELLKPYNDARTGKKEQVKEMFNSIAGKYDFMNRLLTLRIDVLWRKKAVRLIARHPHETILDIGAGTGDFTIELARLKPKKIIGIDIAEKMLEIGREKMKKLHLPQDIKIELAEADAENLPFEDNTFDLTASAFGVRNFENLNRGLSEMLRVLKPGGRILILEASEPEPASPQFWRSGIFKKIYKAYMGKICPALGRAFSENSAYQYLNKSVAAFPTGKNFESELVKAGFINTAFLPLSMGVVSIYIAMKPNR